MSCWVSLRTPSEIVSKAKLKLNNLSKLYYSSLYEITECEILCNKNNQSILLIAGNLGSVHNPLLGGEDSEDF